jgi:hypothetical protein
MMMDVPSSQINLTLNHTIIRLEKTIFNIHFYDSGAVWGGNCLQIFLGIGQSPDAEKFDTCTCSKHHEIFESERACLLVEDDEFLFNEY